ncbi:hypothetical protein Tco_1201722 [Tanacetum coccineum]
MFLYIKGKKNGRMMLESIENGPLVYLTIEENGQIREKKYAEITEQEQLQDNCDVQATNIVLQVLPPDLYSLVNHSKVDKDIWDRVKLLMQGTEMSYQERECKLYNEFDDFTSVKGDDPIACLNKAMAFMSTVMASRFLSTNNQLRTSSNLRNQATIQDGRGEGYMARQCTRPKRPTNSAWFQEKMLLVQVQESGQTDDLDAYDSDCDDTSLAKAILMANLSSYDSDVPSEKAQPIKPTLYDGIVISKKHDVTYVFDEEDSLILEEASRSKMLPKQNDPISKEKKINISLSNYSELNKLAEDFRKYFVPQKELSAEKAFWLQISNPISEQPVVQTTPVKTEASSELPKVSMVKTSVQKLKNHFTSFDKVMKVRTTPNAIIEGSWGFEETKAVFMKEVIPLIKTLMELFNDFDNGLNLEFNEVKIVFNQIEAAVE